MENYNSMWQEDGYREQAEFWLHTIIPIQDARIYLEVLIGVTDSK